MTTVERTKDGWQIVECFECGKKVTYHDRPAATTSGPWCKECRDAARTPQTEDES